MRSNFDKVIGYDEVKAELIRISDVLRSPEKYEKLGVTMPSGVLLFGVPGVGKTLMVKCFIDESGCKSYTLRKEKPNGDFINEIKETFEKAKSEAPAIVFLDDMDKFANEDYMHVDAEEYVTVQSCIDNCKGKGVFTIATANDRYCFPDSLIRAGRFDKVIEIGVPKGETAKQIIRHYLDRKRVIGDIDVEEISMLMEGKSCAELETVINEAGICAGFESKEKIDQKDIVRACMSLMFDSVESFEKQDSDILKKIAIHEAGHAVVAEVLNPGSVSLVTIRRYTGENQGMTKIRSHRCTDYSFEMQECSAIHYLGGKAATELIGLEPDMGCEKDLSNAYDIVRRLVQEICSYGFDSYTTHDSSECFTENRDKRITLEMERLYNRAKKILFKNRDFLNEVIQGLLDNTTLTYRDMQNIRNRVDIVP